MSSPLSFSDAGQVGAAMTMRGYQAMDVIPWLAVPLPMGSMVGMQFGDLIGAGQEGRPQLKLRCVLQINGDLSPSAGMARWTFRKLCASDLACDLALTIDLQLALKHDLRAPDDLRQAGASIQSAWAYRYLLDLVEDMRQTLRGVAVSSARKGWSGPALRLEARVLGDLTMGRTGMVRPCPSAVSRDYMRLASAACDSLSSRILPELRQVIREVSRHRSMRLAAGYSSHQETAQLLPFVDAATLVAESETIQ